MQIQLLSQILSSVTDTMKRAAGSILTTSNRNRILECPDCQKPFRSDILKKHMKTHNKSEECAYCKRVVRIDMMQTHLKTHNPSRRCKFCKKMVRTDLLIKHEIIGQNMAKIFKFKGIFCPLLMLTFSLSLCLFPSSCFGCE